MEMDGRPTFIGVRVARPDSSEWSCTMLGVANPGMDLTVLSPDIQEVMELPPTGEEVELREQSGRIVRVPVYAAILKLGTREIVTSVIAFDTGGTPCILSGRVGRSEGCRADCKVQRQVSVA